MLSTQSFVCVRVGEYTKVMDPTVQAVEQELLFSSAACDSLARWLLLVS